MTKLHAVVLAGAVGCASGALAQVADHPISESDVTIVTFGSSTSGYSARAFTDVYAVGTPTQTGGVYASSGTVAYDDVTIAPGNPFPVVLVRSSIAVSVPADAPPGATAYVRMLFYPNHDNSGANPRPYSGTPIVWDLGPMSGSPISPAFLDSRVFTSPGDRTCGAYIELFSDAAMTMYADGWQVIRRANLPGAILTGSTDPFGWFGPTSGASFQCISSSNYSGGTQANNRATFLTLTAAHPATCSVDFNRDGDTGTDADIESFFACLAGNCCATCLPNADFNGDGDAGTDADIESFFRVLAGGAC